MDISGLYIGMMLILPQIIKESHREGFIQLFLFMQVGSFQDVSRLKNGEFPALSILLMFTCNISNFIVISYIFASTS